MKGLHQLCFIMIASIFQLNVISLRLRQVLIPAYVGRGQYAQLICEYDTETSKLYSVKWFKEDTEFFRYIPTVSDQYQIYPLVGVTMDIAYFAANTSSKACNLKLSNLTFEASGIYQCEVSTEGPQFMTVTGEGSLMVVEPLNASPTIIGGKDRYGVDEEVTLTCVSSPARPAAHLTWIVNGKKARKVHTLDLGKSKDYNGLFVTRSRLTFKTKLSHFYNGNLIIKCVASLAGSTDAQTPTNHAASNQILAKFFNKWENSFEASSGQSRVDILTTFALVFLQLHWKYCSY